MKTSTKLALAALAAIALLIGPAIAPAAAGGPYPLELTGGHFSTDLGDFDLIPTNSGEPPCEPKPTTLAFETTGTTWEITGGYTVQFRPPWGGGWYQADVRVTGDPANPWSGSVSPYDLQGWFVYTIELYNLGSDPGPYDCEKEDLECTITGVFTITSGSFTGSLPNTNVGDVAVIDADTVTTSLPLFTSNCSAPFVALNGTDAALDDLTLTIV